MHAEVLIRDSSPQIEASQSKVGSEVPAAFHQEAKLQTWQGDWALEPWSQGGHGLNLVTCSLVIAACVWAVDQVAQEQKAAHVEGV